MPPPRSTPSSRPSPTHSKAARRSTSQASAGSPPATVRHARAAIPTPANPSSSPSAPCRPSSPARLFATGSTASMASAAVRRSPPPRESPPARVRIFSTRVHRCTGVDFWPLSGLMRQEDPRGGPTDPASPEFASVTGHRALASHRPLAGDRDIRGRNDHRRLEPVGIYAVRLLVRITRPLRKGVASGFSDLTRALRVSPPPATLVRYHNRTLGAGTSPWCASGGRQRQAPGREIGTTQSSSAPTR